MAVVDAVRTRLRTLLPGRRWLHGGRSGVLPAGRSAGRSAPALRMALLLLLAVGLLPCGLGAVWLLQTQRSTAIADAYGRAEAINTETAGHLHWVLQDAQTLLAGLAQRTLQAAPEACDPVFGDFAAVYPGYTTLALRRSDASLRCSSTSAAPPLAFIRDAAWFGEGLRRQGFYAGPAFRGKVSGKWTAALTYPVAAAGETPQALLTLALDLAQLQARLFGAMPDSALSVVIDGSNQVLMRSRDHAERVGQPALAGVARAISARRSQIAEGLQPRAAALQFDELDRLGQRLLLVARPMPGTDWWVVSAISEAAALQDYRQARDRSLLAIAGLLLLALLAGRRVMRSILAPIQGLGDAALAIASGREDRRAPEQGPRELREVAQQFNRMQAAGARSRQALRDSEQRQRELLDHLPVAVMVHAADGSIERLNGRARALLGLAPGQAVGPGLLADGWQLVDADGALLAPARQPFSQVLASGQPLAELVVGLVRRGAAGAEGADGTDGAAGADGAAGPVQRWFSVHAYPQVDAAGRTLRAVVVFVDISAQRAAGQLRSARDSADAASRAKSAFLSRISHELRTPLNAIIGFSHLSLRDARLPPDLQARQEHVLSAGRHLLDLVTELLDIGKIESGALTLTLQPLALRPLLGDCLAIGGSLARTTGIAVLAGPGLQGPVDADPPWVLADAGKLRDVVLNLLSNAIKYNRSGGRVTLALVDAPQRDDGRSLAIEVSDTGPGLSAAELASLFEPLNRLGRETSGIEGHGLGLAISRLNMAAMDGAISVRSTPGQGSCFSLHLRRLARPAIAPAPAAVPLPPAPALPAPTPAAPPPGAFSRWARPDPALQLLYIEDNGFNLMLMREMLADRQDMVLRTAVDGPDGLRAARSALPDLVLLDLGLPGIDGFEVLRQLRADPATAAVPCWAVTADGSDATRARTAAAGFARHVVKPLPIDAFLRDLDLLAARLRPG